ncbi:mucoidy inhibitor MuiA family protein [Mucilaginibacter sp.]|uniref:mucoidy inhibitor MuiA family protein n=1 Tax=Mucilaginibacter sp. TaxID=1882438 RepID=UPI003D09D312
MFKKVLMAVSLFFIAIAAKAGDGQKITSAVQKVVVFLNGAQVTRTAMVNVSEGTSVLVFGEISPGVDVQSIQVHANGEFTILSVKHEMNFLGEEVKQKQVDELLAQQKIIKDKIDLQNNLLAIYQQEEIMLAKNQVVKADNTTLDIVKLKQALDFQTQRLILLKQKQQVVNNQIAALNIELQKYDKQIADINRGHSTATSNILVTVSSKRALQSTFTLSYLVHNASWYPTYDIRAKNVNSPVSISYKANVTQRSGEDWKNIKLTLSTGNPAVSGNKQELNPYYLNFGMYYADPNNNVSRVNGSVFGSDDRQPLPGASIMVKGTTIGTVSDANGNFSLQVPPGSQAITIGYIGYQQVERPVVGSFMTIGLQPSKAMLNEVVVMGYSNQKNKDADPERELSDKVAGINVANIPVAVNQTENQTSVEFNIDNPYSIPSDGKAYLVEINQVEVKASYQYFVAPKVNTDVFLTAQITDWNKYNFLSGEANLYFEGTYIGKSLIDTHNATDTLNLSLGTDKNILVTRTLQKDLTEKQVFGSNKKETRNWLIAVKNHKNQKVNLLVEDQVPVSQNSSIEVELQDASGAKPDPLTGKVSWNFLLNSQDDKKVQLKYLVKYPKSQSVIVQ